MPLLQTISYNADQPYLAGFLQQLIDQSGLNASVAFDGKQISLMMDENDVEALERFSARINSDLPHSLFIGEIQNSHSDAAVVPSAFDSKRADLPLCPSCLRELFDKASPDYCNSALQCSHYGSAPAPSAPVDMEATFKKLMENGSVTIGERTYRRAYETGDMLMLTNPSAIGRMLLLSTEEVQALMSIEKPVIKVALQDEKLKEETGRNVLKAKLFDDAPSTLLSQRLNTQGIDHLFISGSNELEALVYKTRTHIIRPGKLADRPKKLDDSPITTLFLNMVDEADLTNISSIGACMQSSGEWHFIHRSAKVSKPMIRFAPFESSGLVQKLTDSSNARKRLMENFQAAFPENYRALEALSAQDEKSLFDAVGAIIGLEGGFEAISDASLSFSGNGGVKVDVRFGEGSFDTLSFLASLISFKLAGVENNLLTYSLFESLADMATETLSQLKSRLKTNEVILFGDLMANTPFYSRVERNLGNATAHISSRYPLDVQA